MAFDASTSFVVFAVASGIEDLESRPVSTKSEALNAAGELRGKHAQHGILVEIIDATTMAARARWECTGRTWVQTLSWPAEEP